MKLPRSVLAQFRVRTERSKHSAYFNVFVFADRAAMHIFDAAQQRKLGREPEPYFEAQVSSWKTVSVRPDGTERVHRLMGTIVFHADCLGAGIVSHEMTHAALRYAERIDLKVDFQDDGHDAEREERLCWIQGWLVCQFWEAAYEAPRLRRILKA